jgi:hypothetical protein
MDEDKHPALSGFEPTVSASKRPKSTPQTAGPLGPTYRRDTGCKTWEKSSESNGCKYSCAKGNPPDIVYRLQQLNAEG